MDKIGQVSYIREEENEYNSRRECEIELSGKVIIHCRTCGMQVWEHFSANLKYLMDELKHKL